MEKTFKFGIIGIGPTGGILAAHLAKAGHNVVLVDVYKSHMDMIKKKGLTITNLKEFNAKYSEENICYSIDELHNKEVDTLFIAVKASRLNEILPQIKSIVKPTTTLISLQNGFDTEELIAKYGGVENTIRVVVNYAGNLIEEGVIRMSFFNPPNYIGVLSTQAENKAKKLAEIITSAGLDTKFTPDIKKYEWKKCILNCISPVCVTTRTTMKQTMGFSDTRDLCREILRECIEVAKARGINYEPDFLDKAMEYLDKAGHHRVSMEADIDAGNPSEIDFLNGKIVEYGKLEGISTPYNKIFVSLIKGCELPPINHER
ncbi:MAG: ketopantoate reductase family protein [Candidatus Heimdallarchaeota archaeon]